jgi:hypothetical protein
MVDLRNPCPLEKISYNKLEEQTVGSKRMKRRDAHEMRNSWKWGMKV